MRGIGTICNFAAVVIAAFIGMFLKKGIKESVREGIMHSCGVSTMFIGAAGALTQLLKINGGQLDTQNSMVLVLSMVIGTSLGELVDIEEKMNRVGEKFKSLFKNKSDSSFVEGFVTATLVICVGAMAILGPIYDAVLGDASMLFVKSTLDFVIILVFAALYGVGVMFSAVPLLLYQGLITILAVFIEPYLTDTMVAGISAVGSVIVFCVGVNIAFGKKFRVGNMLFAMFLPVLYELILKLF